ncbi:DMT family transporter [Silvanigrella aquatica]|uniref:EamA domain-containing protein n=1 Tax=Silvanigrella aquatica TaxID=1915309 RepID=A0A1L4D3X2_9BACT|nr:DMT family transporter [Silvanigrella aquatica]APJ04880.1 hypothetical protein AXG55_13650 [Silvanigrella aquatica]
MKKLLFTLFIPVFFVLLWSSGYIFVETGLQNCSPMLFLTMRFFIASAIMGGVLLFKGKKIILSKIELLQITITGILIQGVYLGFFFIALDQKVSPGILAIILGIQPLLTPLLMREGIDIKHKIGLFLGFIGLFLTVFNIIFIGNINIYGIICAIMSLIGITYGTVLQKKYCNNIPLDTKMFIHYAASAILILICCLFLEDYHVTWTYSFMTALFWVSVVMSIGAFFLFFALLKLGKASHVTSLLYCVPPVTAVFDLIFFKHEISFYTFLGMSFIILSIFLISENFARLSNNKLVKNLFYYKKN